MPCVICNEYVHQIVYTYALDNFGQPLCRACQDWYRYGVENNKTTNETLQLFLALKARGVPAEIEKFDGHKTIDIAIVEKRVNIEVDGIHHNANPQQAFADLQRTYFSFLKGYLTLRIPNSLVRNNLEETADMITEILNNKN